MSGVLLATRVLRVGARRSFSSPAANLGISFNLSEEQLQLRDTARQFARDHMIPLAPKYDKTMEYPWEVVKKAHQNGLINFHVPKKYGGLELDLVSGALIAEALSFACSGMATAILGNDLAQTPLYLCANDDIQRRYLAPMIEEPTMAAFCVTEPGAGSDVAGIKTRAEKKGDEWIINGQKMWITNGGVASWYFVLARTDPNPKTPPGKAFTAFVVDANLPGVTRGRKEINMGQRCSDTRGITFEDVRVSAKNVIGVPGEGFKVAMKTFDKTRPGVAALACGVLHRALHEATKYSLERKTFGTEIANHQAVQTLLADMTISYEIAMLAALRGAAAVQAGLDGSYFASIAKCYAADACNLAATNAVQIFGGAGFNSEYPAEKLMRDAKIFQIYEGTSQVQRLVICRHLLQKFKTNGYIE